MYPPLARCTVLTRACAHLLHKSWQTRSANTTSTRARGALHRTITHARAAVLIHPPATFRAARRFRRVAGRCGPAKPIMEVPMVLKTVTSVAALTLLLGASSA